jgi:UDP-2-acetamido-3-amino-2,3-dideoxy-glucuronate N-acetyltransferase
MGGFFAHPTACIEKGSRIGEGTKVWHYAHVRKGSEIGKNCVLGHCAYVDVNVKVGNNVKIENKASLFQGVVIEDGVFVGPHVAFTNDRRPRSVSPDWKIVRTLVKKGASIGVNSTVLCGITVGKYAMVGGGSVVTKDVPDHGLVYGNPARLRGFVCICGNELEKQKDSGSSVVMVCGKCDKSFEVPGGTYSKVVRS